MHTANSSSALTRIETVQTHAQKYFAKLTKDRASGIMDDHPDSLDISNTTAEDVLVVKKRRGRPSKAEIAARKALQATMEVPQQQQGRQEAMEPKRKRGRPRKDGRDPIQRKKPTPTTPVQIPTPSSGPPTTVTRSGRRTRPRREFDIEVDSGTSYGTIGQAVQDGVNQPNTVAKSTESIDAAASISAAPSSNSQFSRRSRPDEYQIRRPSQSNISSEEMFPAKLMSLIDAGITSSITWLADGRTFRIVDKDEFMRVASPTYFKLTKIRSFERSESELWPPCIFELGPGLTSSFKPLRFFRSLVVGLREGDRARGAWWVLATHVLCPWKANADAQHGAGEG